MKAAAEASDRCGAHAAGPMQPRTGLRASNCPAGAACQGAVTILEPGVSCPAEPALDAAVDAALRELPDLRRLTVLVNDAQRQTATRPVLEHLVRRVEPRRIRIVIAAGSHEAPSAAGDAFLRDLCGELPFAAVTCHHSRSDALVPIGSPGRWRGHPWLLDADAVLAIGSVEAHYFAGWTGAHKTATVGVAAHEDIEANHAAAMRPECRPGRLEDNPVAEGILAMLSALQAATRASAVNLLQARGHVLAAVGGEPLAALHAALPAAREAFVRHVPGQADAVVAEVTGPLGESFYQADKGIKNNEWAVRDGGCLVLVAPCRCGIGQDAFFRLLRRARTHAEALAAVEARGYRLGDHKAVRLRYLTDPQMRGVRGFLVSEGISGEEAAVLGLTKVADVPAALAAAGIDPARHHVLHVRDAGNLAVLPARGGAGPTV
jgi:nickel-dependent lactate racemase